MVSGAELFERRFQFWSSTRRPGVEQAYRTPNSTPSRGHLSFGIQGCTHPVRCSSLCVSTGTVGSSRQVPSGPVIPAAGPRRLPAAERDQDEHGQEHRQDRDGQDCQEQFEKRPTDAPNEVIGKRWLIHKEIAFEPFPSSQFGLNHFAGAPRPGSAFSIIQTLGTLAEP